VSLELTFDNLVATISNIFSNLEIEVICLVSFTLLSQFIAFPKERLDEWCDVSWRGGLNGDSTYWNHVIYGYMSYL